MEVATAAKGNASRVVGETSVDEVALWLLLLLSLLLFLLLGISPASNAATAPIDTTVPYQSDSGEHLVVKRSTASKRQKSQRH